MSEIYVRCNINSTNLLQCCNTSIPSTLSIYVPVKSKYSSSEQCLSAVISRIHVFDKYKYYYNTIIKRKIIKETKIFDYVDLK